MGHDGLALRHAGTLIVVNGPTASGKSRVAASIARHFGSEVINADSRQFYHALRIGAALPTEKEMNGVRHHFIGHLDVHDQMSAGAFARAAMPVIDVLFERHGRAVMTGGSGLYIEAVCRGFDPLPTGDRTVREQLQKRYQQEGLSVLVEELKQLDPDHWRTIDRRNPHRVIRALEVCKITGKPFSAQRTGRELRKDLNAMHIALDLSREDLHARIEDRVDAMFAAGLLEEARALLPYRELNALRTVGYRELFDHFDGKFELDQCKLLIKQNTRRYAKRQLTWLRRDGACHWMPPDENAIIQFLHEHP